MSKGGRGTAKSAKWVAVLGLVWLALAVPLAVGHSPEQTTSPNDHYRISVHFQDVTIETQPSFYATYGNACTTAWDWGDTAQGVGDTVSHSYSAIRQYAVTFTVVSLAAPTMACGNTGGNGAPGSFTVATKSDRRAEGQLTYSTSGLTLTADASGYTDPDGGASTYGWTFGDGATATGPTTQHTYSTGKCYGMQLKITGDGDAITSVNKSICVSSTSGTTSTTTSQTTTQTGTTGSTTSPSSGTSSSSTTTGTSSGSGTSNTSTNQASSTATSTGMNQKTTTTGTASTKSSTTSSGTSKQATGGASQTASTGSAVDAGIANQKRSENARSAPEETTTAQTCTLLQSTATNGETACTPARRRTPVANASSGGWVAVGVAVVVALAMVRKRLE